MTASVPVFQLTGKNTYTDTVFIWVNPQNDKYQCQICQGKATEYKPVKKHSYWSRTRDWNGMQESEIL